MIQLAELLLDLIILLGIMFIGFITLMLIQLISYKVFKFNIWKKMNKVFK